MSTRISFVVLAALTAAIMSLRPPAVRADEAKPEGKPAAKATEATSTAERLRREADEAWEALKDYAYEQREEYRARMSEKLAELDKEIQAAREDASKKMEKAKKEMAAELEKVIKDLDLRRKDLATRLDEATSATQEAWSGAKAAVRKSLEDMERALEEYRRK